MECIKGDQVKKSIADKLVNCDIHFDSDQLVMVLDIMDDVGVPDVYEALKAIMDAEGEGFESLGYGRSQDARIALAKRDGK